MDEHDDIRSLLTQAAADVPGVAPDAPRVVRRARRRVLGTMTAGALAIVVLLSLGAPAISDLLSRERPAILPAITSLDDGAYIVDLTTGRATRLEGLPSDAVEFDAAPGGEQIAFVSARDGSPQVYVMNMDGTGLRRVTDDPYGASHPAWAPDGARIAYAGFGAGTTRNVFVLDLTTGDARQVTDIRVDPVHPTWDLDGRSILYIVRRASVSQQDIGRPSRALVRQVNLDSGRERRVIAGDPGSVVDVDVASDGRVLTSSILEGSPTLFDIRVVDVGSDGPGRLLYAGGGDDYDPEISPDLTKVAFTSNLSEGIPAVRTVDLQGRPVIGPIHWAHDPTWLSEDLLLVDVGCQEHASAGCPS